VAAARDGRRRAGRGGLAHRLAVLASAIGAALAAAATLAAPAQSPVTAAPVVRHIFLIVLENESYAQTFGARSPAAYLAHTLPSAGLLLSRYYAVGHNSLDNYLALVSGQAPNEDTQGDCLRYSDFQLRAPTLDAAGQALGRGCVYPRLVPSLADQLEAAGLTWKGYMEDMGNDARRERRTCGHAPLGGLDGTELAERGDQYAAKHDPFVYFHAIIDDRARCDAHVVNLDRLPRDLASAATTPNYVFITPNLCHDGHDAPCVDGEPGGLISADAFLRRWVPLIVASAAFRRDGLLIVTFDESSAAGTEMATACCGERPLPGARWPPGIFGPGGGRIGAVLLSPFIKPGQVSDVPFNHYALLRSIEQLYGLAPLGYAASPALPTLARFLAR